MSSKVASASNAFLGRVAADRPVSRNPVTPTPIVGDREPLHPSLVAALAKAGPPVDAEKVQRIREAIAAGSYRVDAKAIAAAMVVGL